MRKRVRQLAMLFGIVLTTGCGDEPVFPNVEAAAPLLSETAVSDEEQQAPACCDPIIVVVPGPETCDPYLSLNWCAGGGDCMMSSGDTEGIFGCSEIPPGGGGTPEKCPTWDPTCAASGDGGGGACDPIRDPDCNQPLTQADSSSFRTAIERHRKPASAFTDPTAASYCAQMFAEFDRLFQAGRVYRGGYNTPENDPYTPTHVGAYDPVSRTMHFEPSVLDAANRGDPAAIRSIFNTALHEAAHSLNYQHSDPLWSGEYDLYAETPFNLLSPGANSCISS